MEGKKAIIGVHASLEALSVYPKNIILCKLSSDYKNKPRLLDIQKKILSNKIPIEYVSASSLNKINSDTGGVVLFIKNHLEFDDRKICSRKSAKVIVLDGVTDPQNLGSILRTSWLFSVDGIIVPQDGSSYLTSVVYKVAAGGATHVPVCRVSNIGQEILKLKDCGFWVYALDNKTDCMSLWDVSFDKKVVLVVGSEGKGVRAGVLKKSDQVVKIPQVNSYASFNASVSLAIGLAEVNRQLT